MEELVRFVIVDSDTTLADIESGLDRSVLDHKGHPSWEVLEAHPEGWEWVPELRMHDLRHSMASNMVNSGRSIYEVAKVLGHTQLKTSQRYSHLSNETLLAAVDASANATGNDWGPAEKATAGENLALVEA